MKPIEAFRSIDEAVSELGVGHHTLRLWEREFSQPKPLRLSGRRFYRPEDMEFLSGVYVLLKCDYYTIRGVQKILREQGVAAVRMRGAKMREVVFANG